MFGGKTVKVKLDRDLVDKLLALCRFGRCFIAQADHLGAQFAQTRQQARIRLWRLGQHGDQAHAGAGIADLPQ